MPSSLSIIILMASWHHHFAMSPSYRGIMASPSRRRSITSSHHFIADVIAVSSCHRS
jgi:hypothetical protein